MKSPEKVYLHPHTAERLSLIPSDFCYKEQKEAGFIEYTRSDTVDKMRALLEEIRGAIVGDHGHYSLLNQFDKKWFKKVKELLEQTKPQ